MDRALALILQELGNEKEKKFNDFIKGNYIQLQVLNEYGFSSNKDVELDKLIEEHNEFIVEHNKKNTKDYDVDKEIAEGLDVITVMLNYLKTIGLTNKHFIKHIIKLNDYKAKKYKGLV